MTPDKPNASQLRWRSHRGMLELDLILLPFFDAEYNLLNKQSQLDYEKLLEFSDPQLFSWLLGTSKSSEPEIQALIERIRSFHANK